jgi:hypothetical protein
LNKQTRMLLLLLLLLLVLPPPGSVSVVTGRLVRRRAWLLRLRRRPGGLHTRQQSRSSLHKHRWVVGACCAVLCPGAFDHMHPQHSDVQSLLCRAVCML